MEIPGEEVVLKAADIALESLLDFFCIKRCQQRKKNNKHLHAIFYKSRKQHFLQLLLLIPLCLISEIFLSRNAVCTHCGFLFKDVKTHSVSSHTIKKITKCLKFEEIKPIYILKILKLTADQHLAHFCVSEDKMKYSAFLSFCSDILFSFSLINFYYQTLFYSLKKLFLIVKVFNVDPLH